MTKTFKILGTFVIGLVLGLGGIALAYSGGSPQVVVEGNYIEASNEVSLGKVQYDEQYFNGDLYANANLYVTGNTAFTGDVSMAGDLDLSGFLTTERLSQGGAWFSTSTAETTSTLTESHLLSYKGIYATLSGASMTYTLPASSTITSLIPNDGDSVEWYAYATGAIMSFAPGTGIDIQVATTTTGAALTVGNGGMGKFTLIREPNTDILATFETFY